MWAADKNNSSPEWALPYVITVFMENIDIFELSKNLREEEWLTVEQYEQKMAPFREALKKMTMISFPPIYENLTIRRFVEFWEKASGGRRYGYCHSIEDVASYHDIDSPEGFYYWLEEQGHQLDLEYASITFSARCVNLWNILFEEEQVYKWALFLMGHPGDARSLAIYCHRLQEAGVHFALINDPDKVLRRFNIDVGVRKRYLRNKENTRKQ